MREWMPSVGGTASLFSLLISFKDCAIANMAMYFYLYLILGSLVAIVLYRNRRRSRYALPPGPPGDPIIGHMRVIPRDHQADVYYEWSKTYGDVVYLELLGRPIVVLNSQQVATELLDKRGAIYSDRPSFPHFEELGWTGTVTFLRYGEQFFKQRKVLQAFLSKQNCRTFNQVYIEESRKLLQRLANNPKEFDWNVRRFGAAVVMNITYGHQINSDDDEYIKMTENVSNAHAGLDPGASPIDLFPSLRHLPAWFPGAWFIRHINEWKWAIREFHDFPFEQVKKQMAAGTAQPSFLASQIEMISQEGYNGEYTVSDAKAAAGAIYAGGAETTWSTIVIFLFAMLLNPEIQERAQKEIDEVIGNDRLPEFSDRPKLPYVEAVVQETIRWQPVTPLVVPHRCMQDDVYNGMFIPKGSLVFANARAMTLDERVYRNPHDFYPDRYLAAPQGWGEPYSVAHFGFGRRVCPGRHLADGSIWMATTCILAALKVSKPIGPDGNPIVPEVAFTSGLSSHPKPFQCDIKPRSEKAMKLIMQHQS